MLYINAVICSNGVFRTSRQQVNKKECWEPEDLVIRAWLWVKSVPHSVVELWAPSPAPKSSIKIN